ncbi:hypothetical protein AB0F93_03670 [Micromonospora tulbaghiae]|uniref:hypothetical protein n=1 Tax=Micromonospora tulbaghiae TaxID=479978 RepID=UPI0033336FBA
MRDGPMDISVREIRTALREHNYRHANEIELHGGIEDVLTGLGLTPRREVRLAGPDRIDFMVDLPRTTGPALRLGIEAKIAGRSADVWRQLTRYAGHDQVDELMLVTTVYRQAIQLAQMGQTVAGKPLTVTLINRGQF